MKGVPQASSSTRAGATTQGRVGIIGGRAYGRRCSLPHSGVEDGALGGVGELAASISSTAAGTTVGGCGGGGISEGYDWMSNAEEVGAVNVMPPEYWKTYGEKLAQAGTHLARSIARDSQHRRDDGSE